MCLFVGDVYDVTYMYEEQLIISNIQWLMIVYKILNIVYLKTTFLLTFRLPKYSLVLRLFYLMPGFYRHNISHNTALNRSYSPIKCIIYMCTMWNTTYKHESAFSNKNGK